MELSDVLSDKEPEKPEVTEAPPVETEKHDYSTAREKQREKENVARGRDPSTGKFTPKEEVEAKVEPKPEVKVEAKPEPKREEFTEKERAFLRGLEEERRKRQDLERRLADYEKAKATPQGEKKTFWDDPEGALKSFEQGLEQKLTQREMNAKLQTSETIARSRYQDFDEKVEAFAGLMKDTPALYAQMISASDPAEFVYSTAKKHKMLEDAGSIDGLRAKIEKETRAKLEAEYKAKNEELEKQRSALTGSLSDVRGGSTQQKPVYSGPTSLDDILKGK